MRRTAILLRGSLRRKQLQAYTPGNRLPRLQDHHARIPLSPFFLVRISEIELRLDSDKILVNWRVNLNGFDFGRKSANSQAVFCGGIGNLDYGVAARLALEIQEAIIKKQIPESLAVRL